ncbi:hypothetical protein [Cohnella panacarvi]|uniref:hypothetical protein n=1 Tax=Cohnella panacarvi TaxID=400776 RepID=UPI000478DF86|nr:hypothetical protein [Cohnella panacarvi]
MSRFLLPMKLQLFAEGEAASGVEGTPAAGEQSQVSEPPGEPVGDQSGEPAKPNNFEKAFAKRLSEKEAQWNTAKDAEIQALRDQYKDYDTFKLAAEYLQQKAGVPDMLTLKEEIELVRLQERAEKEKVPPSVLKRIDELEAKAAKGEEYEALQKEQAERQEFETSLKTFSDGKTLGDKQLDHTELWKYMHENEIANPEVAYKAMRADLLEEQLKTAEEDAVKKYLESKKAPKAEGAPGAAARQVPTTGGGFKGAEQRAAERIRAARTAE